MNKGMNAKTAQRDDWQTPKWLFRLLHEKYQFTIDAAASSQNTLMPRFWCEAEDGLAQSWAGERVFWNPPFSRKLSWAKKAAERQAALSVGILPATLDQQWMHRYVLDAGAEVFVPKGRVSFVPPPGVIASTPRFATLIVVYATERNPNWRSGGDWLVQEPPLPFDKSAPPLDLPF